MKAGHKKYANSGNKRHYVTRKERGADDNIIYGFYVPVQIASLKERKADIC